MDFKEGLLAAQRRCKDHTDCAECKLDIETCPFASITKDDDIDKAVKVVEDWAATHKPVTLLKLLKKRLPNVMCNEKGYPAVCPSHYFGQEIMNTIGSCRNDEKVRCADCWNQPAPQELPEQFGEE